MFQVDLREVLRSPVATRGELAGSDPLLDGLEAELAEPVRVSGRLQAAGEGRFYWHGALRTVVVAECRRCLAVVRLPVAVEVAALFTQDGDALDDPDSYPVARDATEIDVRPAVREELFLAVPRYVLCREDCRGLCPRCGQDLNAGPCGCPPAVDPRWGALAGHKDRPRD